MSDAAIPTSYGLYFLFQTPVGLAIVVSLLAVIGLYFLKRRIKLEDIFGGE